MRVWFALPISKPINRGSFIAGSDGERHWVKFKYERLPLFCHYCGMLGHDVKICVEHFAVTKSGGTMDYQYGDFLKAMGGRPRVELFVGKQGGSEYSSNGGGENSIAGFYRFEGGLIRSKAWLQQNRAVTSEDGQCRNPSNDEEGQSIFSGTTPQVQERDREDLAHANYVVSCIADVHKSVSDLKEILVQKEYRLPSGLDGKASVSHVMGLSGSVAIKEVSTARLNAIKPKSSWTRFNRMDFGLGGLQKVLLPSIGKRQLPSEFEDNQTSHGEEGRIKRGKLENEEATIFERVVAGSNEAIMLELARAWEPLDRSKPSQTCEGTSSHCVFSYGNTPGQRRI